MSDEGKGLRLQTTSGLMGIMCAAVTSESNCWILQRVTAVVRFLA